MTGPDQVGEVFDVLSDVLVRGVYGEFESQRVSRRRRVGTAGDVEVVGTLTGESEVREQERAGFGLLFWSEASLLSLSLKKQTQQLLKVLVMACS